MLQLLIHIIFISVICLAWGIPGLMLLNKDNQYSFWIRSSTGFFCFLYFSGLITLSFVTSILCLFIALNFSSLLIATLGLILFLFFKQKKIKSILQQYHTSDTLEFGEIVFVVICILIFIMLGTLMPVNSDTQIYHVQIIKWTNEYGTVPGLANLFPRYGLGSNWFTLISAFKISFFTPHNYTWLNTTTVIWFFLWLVSNLSYHNSRKHISSSNKILSHLYFLILIFFLFEWELFRDTANSTNYDFIVTSLTITAIFFLLEEILLSNLENKFSVVFIILCISIIPFKLSGAFSFLLILYYLYHYKKIRYWGLTLIIGIFITTPLLIKNYIATGYPLFPISLSFSSPDWQVPIAMVDYLRQFIHVTNRYYNFSIDHTHIPELLQAKWIGYWFNGILIQQKIIFIAAFSAVFLLIRRPGLYINHKRLKLLLLTLLLMATGWFFLAPSPRFGYGMLLILAFLPSCMYLGKYLSTGIQKPILYIITFAASFYLINKSQTLVNYPEHILFPFPLKTPASAKQHINGIEINIPGTTHSGWMRDCIDTELPCACQENIHLYPRGNSLKKGFRMNQKPDSAFVRQYVY